MKISSTQTRFIDAFKQLFESMYKQAMSEAIKKGIARNKQEKR